MNIQNLLMESASSAKELNLDTVKLPMKPGGEDHHESSQSQNNNGILSPKSMMFSRDNNSRFWPHVATSSFSGNIFLPPTRPLASTDTSTTADSHNSHSLPSFVDLSADQNMICPLCKKVFRFEKNLLRHMQKTHATGEAESVLKCKLCNYTTRHYSNMYVHIRTHTGDKPYSCSGCGASFTQGSSLKLHIKSRHEDNTSLFSLTKKPGKNNLTKLWTRVYKKDLSKFSNYGLGNYFSPFNVPNLGGHPSHDLLLPFSNFLTYPRLPQLPYMSNCSPQYSNINSNPHNLPMFLSRLPFLPPHFRQDNLDHPDSVVSIVNGNSPEKSMANNPQTFRNKKAILSISDFVNDDKPLSRLTADEGDDFKSSEEDDCSMKHKDKGLPIGRQDIIMDKDEENNSEILSVVDFDIDESVEKLNVFNDPINDFLKTVLCNQNPQNFDQLFQILQSMGPAFIQKLKPFFPSKLAAAIESNNNSPQKLSHFPLMHGYGGLQQQDTKLKYPTNGLLQPSCISRNSNLFPFSVRPTFQSLLNQSPAHSDLSNSWSDLFGKISQLSDKSLFYNQSQVPTNQSLRSSMMPPSNMFGIVGYPPLMKMIDKASNQFLQ